jgi:glutaredoxin
MTKGNIVYALFVSSLLRISVEGLSCGSFERNRCSSRRKVLKKTFWGGGFLTAGLIRDGVHPPSAVAAPPISVIAEELGYFPVTSKNGDVKYVPKRVSRKSSAQAVELANVLKEKGVTMYGAYWCPHCSRQKELFGAEAWSVMNYVECSPKGYDFQGQKMCKGVEGYPTFRDKTGRVINVSGERSLDFLAQQVQFSKFDPSLEEELPAMGTACKLPSRQ